MTASALDELISDPRLQPSARAALLVRACVVAQAVRPDVLDQYWGDLKGLAGQLPAASRESFEGLRDTLEPPTAASLGGFAGKITETLDAAKHSGDSDALVAALRDSERSIRRRMMPAGKKAAWEALVRSWIDVDRAEGLMRLDHLRAAVQTNLLIRENDRAPLEAEEWDTVHRLAAKGARAAVEELLEREEPSLNLSAGMADDVGEHLIKEMFKGGGDDTEAERKRDAARARFAKLVSATVERSPDDAGRLLESWFRATAETKFYAENWPGRFIALFRLAGLWSSHPALEPRLGGVVSANAPAHVKDAVLAHAAGLKPTTPAEAEAAWAALEPRLTDKGPAEHWFLLTVLRAGMPDHALEMARRSPRADQIVPSLRLAWLYEHPESARAAISREDVAGDEIAEFLLEDAEGRVEFLRTRTDSGGSPLPEVMWRPPSMTDLLQELGTTDEEGTKGTAIGSWFSKNEKPETQFAAFVRMNGYGQHLYENLDPILLATLVAWDDAHPDEVGPLAGRMWQAMERVIKAFVRLDLLRNAIMERCQAVLGCHPETAGRFVEWIDAELVKKSVTQSDGTTTYTFSLNERAPFVFAFLTAQKVASVSGRRCDEILKIAINRYTATDDLIMAAGNLYAADKGMAGIDPPAKLKQPSQLGAWQLGVVETAFRDILAALVSDSAPKADVSEAFHAIPALGVRFDIDKLGSGAYGLASWKVFWGAVDPAGLSGVLLYEGDTAATLNGGENVYCIALRTDDRAALQSVREKLERSPEFERVAASPRFVDEKLLAGEPLPEAGRISLGGELEGEGWSKAGLEAARAPGG